MALVFTNFGKVLNDNPAFTVWCLATATIVLLWIPVRRLLPQKVRQYTPGLVLWGLGVAAPQNVWYVFTVLVVFWVWRGIKSNCPRWYDHANFFVTAAVIMGSGFSGFCILAFPGDYMVSLGGAFGDSCHVPTNMPGI